MIIKSCQFIKSAVKPSHFPPPMPEIAFSGRSNVGKSSLINTLLNRKKLAKTGSTPGRTQLINFFAVNETFYFVDLPGYGFAKVAKNVKDSWGPMIETFLKTSSTLRSVVFLIDIRHAPRTEEFQFIQWLDMYHIHFIPVLTKADKLSKSKQLYQQKTISTLLSLPKDRLILFSAKTKQGKSDLWHLIEERIHETIE